VTEQHRNLDEVDALGNQHTGGAVAKIVESHKRQIRGPQHAHLPASVLSLGETYGGPILRAVAAQKAVFVAMVASAQHERRHQCNKSSRRTCWSHKRVPTIIGSSRIIHPKNQTNDGGDDRVMWPTV
jgi:hypothetical protein